MTVVELYAPWLARMKMTVKPSYLDDLEQAWQKYVAPRVSWYPPLQNQPAGSTSLGAGHL